MELAPDDDMNGLFGIEPVSAVEVRPAPAAEGAAAAREATATATASSERWRGTPEDFDDAGAMSCAGYGTPGGPSVGTGSVGDAVGWGTGAGPPPPPPPLGDGLGEGLGLAAGFGAVVEVEPGLAPVFLAAARLRCAAFFWWCRCFLYCLSVGRLPMPRVAGSRPA